MEMIRSMRARALGPAAKHARCGVGNLFVGLLLVGASAAPAWAAQVVDVRVGKHSGYARIVFELDTPVGYRIERSEPAPGIAELVISLDASAEEKKLPADSPIIEGVELEPAGDHAVAHIRLRQDGLRLKEMILANPPRIVLDVLAPKQMIESTAAADGEDPPPPAAAPSAQDGGADAGQPADRGPFASGPDESGQPDPLPVAAQGASASEPSDGMMPGFGRVADELAAKAEAVAAATAKAKAKAMTRAKAARAKPPASRSKGLASVPPPVSQEGSMFNRRNIAIVGGFALIGLLGFVFLRKRGADDADMDDVPLVDEGLFDDVGLNMGDMDSPSQAGQGSLFEADTRAETPIPSLAGVGLAGAGGSGVSGDVERRLAELESQLAEANQNRERLESQVAAQTEELRVQRAAIARTQRAVRNLNRPEDEDAPTEPALRDPQRPGGPRA